MDPAVAREMLTTTQHNVPDTLTPVVQGQPQCTVVFGPLTGLIFNFDKPPGSKDPYTCFYLGDFQPGGLKGFLDTALHEAHPEHAEELKFYISNNRYPAAEFVRVFHAGTWMSLKRARGAIALGQGAHGQQDNQPVQLQEEELELESTDTNEEEQVEEAEVDGEEEEEVEEEEEEEEDLQAAAPEVEQQVEETEEEEEEEEDQEEEDHEGEQDEAAAAALLQAAALALDHGSAGLEDAEPMSAQEGGLARQAPGLHAGASVPAEGSSGSSGTCNGASRAACLQGSAPSAALAGPPLAGNEQQGKASKLNVEMGMKMQGYPTRAWGLAGTCLGMLFCILAFFMMQGLVKRPLEAVIVQLESQLATASADLLLWKQAPQHSHQENLQLESQLSAATTQLHSYQAANLQLESQLAVANTRLGIAYLGLGVLAAAVMCMLLGTSRRILHGRSGMENKSNNFVSLAAKELPAQNTPRKAEEGTQTDMHMTNNESKIVELESKLCGVDDRYKVHVARLEEENNALRVKQEYAQAQLESSVRATVLAQAALAERNEELSFLKQTDARAHQLFELKELLDSAKELLNSVRSAFGGTQMSEQITDPKDVLSKIVSWMDWAQGHELEADDAPHAARDQYDI